MNMNGLSEAERSHRQQMLEWNKQKIIDAMREADFPNPVCIVADANNQYGKQIAVANLILMEGLDPPAAFARIEKQSKELAKIGQFPTQITINSWDFVAEIMPMTSPTAAESMEAVRQILELETDLYLAIGIAAGGNSYQVIQIPDMKMPSDFRKRPTLAQDGQHRHDAVREFVRRQAWNNQNKKRNRPR